VCVCARIAGAGACTLFMALTSAPFSTRHSATAGCLLNAAFCNGVVPCGRKWANGLRASGRGRVQGERRAGARRVRAGKAGSGGGAGLYLGGGKVGHMVGKS
jgi:hypothetical protein